MEPRVVPHNNDAERMLLGGIIIDNARLSDALSVLTAKDFFRDAHRRIFEAILELHEQESAVDLLLLCQRLSTTGQLDEVGGPSYVAGLIDGMPKSANVKHYAAVVREMSHLRAIVRAATKATAEAYQAEKPAAEIAETASRSFLSAAPAASSVVPLEKEMMGYYSAIVSGTAPDPISTGFTDVDQLLRGGLRPGNLVIVAGRPSIGKTSWATCVADHVARKGQRVLFFSLEMSPQEIASRVLALRSGVPTSILESGESSPAQAHTVADIVGETGIPFLIEASAQNPAQMSAWCDKVSHEYGKVTVVVVDYMQMMSATRSRDSDQAEMASISRALKSLAREHKAVVIALSQLSRSLEGRRDKRPQLSDLRGSGALEQDCDVAILLYRGEVYGDEGVEGIAEVIVAKNRQGPTGTRRLAFIKDVTRFANLAEE